MVKVYKVTIVKGRVTSTKLFPEKIRAGTKFYMGQHYLYTAKKSTLVKKPTFKQTLEAVIVNGGSR